MRTLRGQSPVCTRSPGGHPLFHWLLALALCFSAAIALAQPLQPIPALQAHVIDQTASLPPAARQALEDKLSEFERLHGSQLVVLIIATTAPEDIAAYAWRVADQWKLGRRDVGDGLLLVVAKDDRSVRIEVARKLEGAIPDLLAWRIIDRLITPAFRAGDFAGGIDAALDALFSAIKGEDLPAVLAQTDSADGDIGMAAVMLLILVPLLSAVASSFFGRKFGPLITSLNTIWLAKLLSGSLIFALFAALGAGLYAFAFGGSGSGSGRGGGGGGSGGGSGPVFRSPRPIGGAGKGRSRGGFSSGGGGSFGGGGASGRW